jgi:hypothetical protein
MTDVPETTLPDDETARARCPHCDQPFHTTHLRDLHVGERHPSAMTDVERTAYEAALEVERDELFGYQLRVVIVLGVTYAMMVILLMVLVG